MPPPGGADGPEAALDPPSRDPLGPAAPLFDELPLPLVALDGAGAVIRANPAARALLDGAAGRRLEEAMALAHARAAPAGAPVEIPSPPGPFSDPTVLLARTDGGAVAALLDRAHDERQRAELRTLRALLAAASEGEPARRSLERLLGELSASLGGVAVLLFELDAGARTLSPSFALRLPPQLAPLCAARPLGAEGAANAALARNAPVHVPDLARSPFAGDRVAEAGGIGTFVLPVTSRGQPSGALQIVARTDALGEGALRLLQGCADAVGLLQGRERQERALADAREATARRDRVAALGRLSAGVAHEINNPLASLTANLSVLADLLDAPGAGRPADAAARADEAREILLESQAAVARIKKITAALTGLSRGGAGAAPISFDPGVAIRDVALLFEAGRHGAARVALDLPPLPAVRGAPGELGQALLNLLDNALDAQGGAGAVAIAAAAPDERVEIRVTDTGPGIAPYVQPHVFEPFFTTKPFGQGTGLGLYVSYQIVARMGGRLRFETGAAGTTFVIELPVADPGAARSSQG